jgi:hypothetical protein
MKVRAALAVVLLAGVPLGGVAADGPSNPRLARTFRYERNGWIHLRIEGTARERGYQHGVLLAREIAATMAAYRFRWEYESGMDWSWLVFRSASFLTPKVDSENLAEIDGLVEGLAAAGVTTSRDEMVAYNGYFELADYWWPLEKKKLTGESSRPNKESCSAFIATGKATKDGGIVLGHNTMTSYITATAQVVLDIVPDRGHRILMQAWPGWIHSGTDFFVTSGGLVGAETTIGAFEGFDEGGVPEFARMRRATQDANSIDEWVAAMKAGNNGGYANAWLIGDVKTGEIARLELGLKYVALERTRDGFYVGSNVAENLKLLRFETKRNELDVRLSSVARRVRWKQLMRENAGSIDIEKAKAFEGDHWDPYLGRVNPSARSLCGHFELDPENAGGPDVPFSPEGTIDAKVVDSSMARRMAFWARFGTGCDLSFDAKAFLAAHPQFDVLSNRLESRAAQPWTEFRAGERRPSTEAR